MVTRSRACRVRMVAPRPVMARVRAIVGVLLLVVGLVGLVLPIIPGIPLLLAGVALTGKDHPLVRPVLVRLRRLHARWQSRRVPAK